MIGIWLAAAAVVALIGGVVARVRVARTVSDNEPLVTDEVLRSLLEAGQVEVTDVDEPLDEEEIRRAEDEFWSSEWEDAEPWSR